MRIDARLPVRLLTDADRDLPLPEPDTLLLALGRPLPPDPGWTGCRVLSGPGAVPPPDRASHPAGCSCCVARSALAIALSAAFEGRARGTQPWFRQVWLALPPDLAAGASSDLRNDPLAAGRFRAA